MDDMHLAEGGRILSLGWGEVEGSCESGGLCTWREAGLNVPSILKGTMWIVPLESTPVLQPLPGLQCFLQLFYQVVYPVCHLLVSSQFHWGLEAWVAAHLVLVQEGDFLSCKAPCWVDSLRCGLT